MRCQGWQPPQMSPKAATTRNTAATTARPCAWTTSARAKSSLPLAPRQEADDAPPLLHPSTVTANGILPHLKSLSPSSILEFQKCPQSFLFQYIYKIKQPANAALAKGSMCHAALEQVFDLAPADRTLVNLQNLYRKHWSQNRLSKLYRPLFETTAAGDTDTTTGGTTGTTTTTTTTAERDLPAERAWGQQGLQLLENYVAHEDPRTVPRPNPVQREQWVKAQLPVESATGVTGYTVPRAAGQQQQRPDDQPGPPESFLVRGIVDRLDLVKDPVTKSVALRIVDYKTGKAPNLKYSAAMNEQIANEAFFQLKIYALLIRETGLGKSNTGTSTSTTAAMDLRWLRLFYLTSEQGPAAFMDMDLGATAAERDRLLQDVHADLAATWTAIGELVSKQDPMLFVGCDRSFCYCHKCRPKFVPGTVWEPPGN